MEEQDAKLKQMNKQEVEMYFQRLSGMTNAVSVLLSDDDARSNSTVELIKSMFATLSNVNLNEKNPETVLLQQLEEMVGLGLIPIMALTSLLISVISIFWSIISNKILIEPHDD